ncbi:MAG: hypothetical protein ACUZ8H_11495 [Candidatus Anammoxibacter sp.]
MAKQQKVKYTDNTSVDDLERRIMVSVVDKAWDKMDEVQRLQYEQEIIDFEEKLRIDDSVKLKDILSKLKVKSLRGISPAILLSAGLGFKMGGFMSYQILVIVMAAIGRTFGAKIAMGAVTRAAFLAIPIVNIISAIWLIWDVRQWICGPSLRKVIPAVLIVGVARIKGNV